MKERVKYLIISNVEMFFLTSPFVWAMFGVFNFPDGKSFLSRLIPVVVLYCLFRFKGEWRNNLRKYTFRIFSVANIILFIYFTLQHIIYNETFSFARTLLLVQIYLSVLPWRKVKISNLTVVIAVAGIATGVSAIYEIVFLNISRAGYLASNPIPYATFSAILLVSCLFFLLTLKSTKWVNFVYSIGALGAMVAIVLSGTRGIWLAVLVTLLLLIVPLLRQATPKTIITTVAAVLLITSSSFYAIGDKLTMRYQQTIAEFNKMTNNNMDTSIGIRLQLWERGWSYIKESPLLGASTSGYLQKIVEDKNSGLITYTAAPLANAHFHNQYIDTLVRTGIIGLFFILSWILLPVWLSYKKQLQLKNWVLACTAIILVAGLTDVPFHHTHVIYTYTMLMGVILIKSETETKTENEVI